MITKAQATKENKDKLNSHKIKMYYFKEHYPESEKKSAPKVGKLLKITYLIRMGYSEYIKNYNNSTIKTNYVI